MNTIQYNQAINTPFGSGYLADAIGFNIDQPGGNAILSGIFEVSPSVSLLPDKEDFKVLAGASSTYARFPHRDYTRGI